MIEDKIEVRIEQNKARLRRWSMGGATYLSTTFSSIEQGKESATLNPSHMT